jgi:hypothetical protein
MKQFSNILVVREMQIKSTSQPYRAAETAQA